MKAQDANSCSVQGFLPSDLVRTFGSPLYVYDGGVIRQKVVKLRNAFSGIDLKIKYACKANTNLEILRLMKQIGVELDVVSFEEMQLALRVGYVGSEVTFTPSGVPLKR